MGGDIEGPVFSHHQLGEMGIVRTMILLPSVFSIVVHRDVTTEGHRARVKYHMEGRIYAGTMVGLLGGQETYSRYVSEAVS